MKPLFPIHAHPNDPKAQKLFILLSPPYPYHAYCLFSPQTGAKIIADIQLGSSLMIIKGRKEEKLRCTVHCPVL